MNFSEALELELLLNLNNDHKHNYDEYRFGKKNHVKKSVILKVKEELQRFLKPKRFYIDYFLLKEMIPNIYSISAYNEDLKILYNLLEDSKSKSLLIKLIALRILGPSKVKLPINSLGYWQGIRSMEKLANLSDFIQIKFNEWRLVKLDLNPLGIPIKFYFSPYGAYIDFILKQYQYESSERVIGIKDSDYVIDAGGCWGDTALYFANAVGSGGKVITFEFIPSNIEILKRNLDLNADLKKRVSLVENPLWDESGLDMYYIDNGPGSKVFFDRNEKHDGNIKTISIDDFVNKHDIPRINFIKMDIEGAENHALKGAIKTISKFKPVLAIAIYHNMNDFVKIAQLVNDFNLGYRFYLGHYTIHLEETILFAIAND